MADTKTPQSGSENPPPTQGGALAELDAWFLREVLPLEAALMHFLRRNWRNRADFADLRQDVYVRIYEAARKQRPSKPRAFLFTTARNLLINRVRREQIVPIETFADLDMLESPDISLDRTIIARDELRLLQDALETLAPRAREAITLRQIEGLSLREIAQRMNIAEKTVERHITIALRGLADYLYAASDDTGKQP